MSRERGNNREALSEYEQLRLENVARNKKKMDMFNIPKMGTAAQHGEPKKRTKRTHQPSDAATEGHHLRARPQINYAEMQTGNLRARPQRNSAQIANQQIGEGLDCQSVGGFLCDNEDLPSSSRKKRRGRGITRMESIFARTPDMPKLKILLNTFGQPVGENARKLSSVLGCQVRRKISIGCADWRLVSAEKKYEVWTDIKAALGEGRGSKLSLLHSRPRPEGCYFVLYGAHPAKVLAHRCYSFETC